MSDTTNESGAAPAAPPSEKELIEAAARAAPAAKGTTSDRAMNIIQASVIQREAISKAYEAQKKNINDAVKEQRVAAMEQMTTAKKQFTERDAIEKMQQAQSATRNLVSTGENPAGSTGVTAPAPQQSIPQASPPATPAQAAPAPPHQATAPAANPDLAPEAPIANELANTIRAIISEEVDKQLKELLAIHTAQTQTAPPTENEGA
ncbi:hypothetical protein [Kordiimonas sp.]|uniref:hypothetical protein n=1 Tax=Kordiimonas sp. TaxID=1970157 RepID=UPI003A8EF4D2